MLYDVITVGDATIDAFLHLADENKKIHLNQNNEFCIQYGEKIDVASSSYMLGGNAANIAVGIARLGHKSALFAEIGGDEFSLKILNSLALEHVDRGFVKTIKDQQSSFSIALNFKGDRTLFVEHIKRDHNFNYTDVSAKWMYLTSLANEWKEPYKKALEFCQENSIQIAFNPGTPQLAEVENHLIRSAVSHSDILFVNKEEAETILFGHILKHHHNDEEHIQKLAKELQSLGPKTVIITNGMHGSYCLDNTSNWFIQGPSRGKVVERTGAGDAYASGFLSGTLYGKSIQECMEWGSKNAAGCVSQIGAQKGLLRKSEIEILK